METTSSTGAASSGLPNEPKPRSKTLAAEIEIAGHD
jgi:hypothetical protein